MRALLVVVATVVICALCGCPKQGPRSVDYQQAQYEFTQLYGRYVEDAYLRPEMTPIEQKLEKVPENSADYMRAQELLKRIRSGRERVSAENESRREAVAEATKPVDDFEFQKDDTAPKPEAPAAVDAGLADAGPSGDHPAPGMTAFDVMKKWGDCFLQGPELELPGKGTAQTLTLRESAYCLQHHPGYDQQLVVLEDGKVSMFAAKKDLDVIPADAGPTKQMEVERGEDGGIIKMTPVPAPSPADAG